MRRDRSRHLVTSLYGRANPFALERIRYYDLRADGTLSLSTRYDSGKEAAVSLWKRN